MNGMIAEGDDAIDRGAVEVLGDEARGAIQR
jgi:hypothetical protein